MTAPLNVSTADMWLMTRLFQMPRARLEQMIEDVIDWLNQDDGDCDIELNGDELDRNGDELDSNEADDDWR